MIKSDPTIIHHPLGSESVSFNKFVEAQANACAELESGKISGEEFDRRYQIANEQYLIDLGIMSSLRRRL
jgi:hypothetical protein